MGLATVLVKTFCRICFDECIQHPASNRFMKLMVAADQLHNQSKRPAVVNRNMSKDADICSTTRVSDH